MTPHRQPAAKQPAPACLPEGAAAQIPRNLGAAVIVGHPSELVNLLIDEAHRFVVARRGQPVGADRLEESDKNTPPAGPFQTPSESILRGAEKTRKSGVQSCNQSKEF